MSTSSAPTTPITLLACLYSAPCLLISIVHMHLSHLCSLNLPIFSQKGDEENDEMARADNEISSIINTLHTICWRHTDRSGVARRPFGNDLVLFERHMSRLLILRGVVSENEPHRFTEDPWAMFRREYGPVSARPRDGFLSAPRGILNHNGSGNHSPIRGTSLSTRNNQTFAPTTRLPPSTAAAASTSNPTPGCRVRWAPNLPGRPHGTNGSSHPGSNGSIPRWIN